MDFKFKKLIKNSLPIAFAYIILGFTFGVLFSAKGGSPLESFLISALGYSGATQFIALEFYQADFSTSVFFFTLLLINLRHIIYGVSFLNIWKDKFKYYLFGTLTDETFALSRVYREKKPSSFEWFKIHFLNQFYWVFGCVLGSIIPSDFIHRFVGADFALVALFISILASSMRKEKNDN